MHSRIKKFAIFAIVVVAGLSILTLATYLHFQSGLVVSDSNEVVCRASLLTRLSTYLGCREYLSAFETISLPVLLSLLLISRVSLLRKSSN